MFYGEYEHSIDTKGRLIIPSKFRDSFKAYEINIFFITKGLERCLFMFTENEWKAQEAKFKAFPLLKAEARKFNRIFFSGASQIDCDKQGRILIPKYLKDYAGIKRDVMIIGVSSRIEIWGKEPWLEYYNNSKDSFEDVAERLITPEG